MSPEAFPLRFSCGGVSLVGIVHPTIRPAQTGVVIVVGGPQYRVGSHRQFVLLARALAAAGIPVLRFDVRGMGDSGGDFPGFEEIDDDIGAAIDAFSSAVPGLDRVVLWGLCDGASASLFYAHKDPRVGGLVLLNPWIRTETTYARTELKHYYAGKLGDRVFWRRLATGGIAIGPSVRSFWQRVRAAALGGRSCAAASESAAGPIDRTASLPERMVQGLAAFAGPVLLIMSGNDLTAREFDEVSRASRRWTELLSHERIERHDLAAADHTFSRAEWTDAVNEWTIGWIRALEEAAEPRQSTVAG